MTVGETLTEARSQAGLSIDELSERTRIRGTVIRSIEDDDYADCGGDLYVRGYVRAIAGAVGIDAQPLIREYDQGRAIENERAAAGHAPEFPSDLPPAAAPGGLDTTRFDLPAVDGDPAVTAYDLPQVPDVAPTTEFTAAVAPAVPPPPAAQPPGTAETRYDLAAVPGDLMAAGYDFTAAEPAEPNSATAVIPVPDAGAAGQEPDARQPDAPPSAAAPAGPAQPAVPPAGRGRGRRRGLFAVAALVVLLAAGFLGVKLGTGSTSTTNTAATSAASAAAASASAQASAAAQASASAAARASASAQASASASAQARREAAAKAAAARVVTLPVASVAAYGPDGYADGDEPGNAKNAIARDASQPWTTQWYVTPTFGMLKHGTGLLLDLGGKVTVTSIRLELAAYQGSDVQIRVGNGTAARDLRVAAQASNAAGDIKLTLREPTAARYLLIWFTQLPPDGAGHYMASAANVVVTGRR